MFRPSSRREERPTRSTNATPSRSSAPRSSLARDSVPDDNEPEEAPGLEETPRARDSVPRYLGGQGPAEDEGLPVYLGGRGLAARSSGGAAGSREDTGHGVPRFLGAEQSPEPRRPSRAGGPTPEGGAAAARDGRGTSAGGGGAPAARAVTVDTGSPGAVLDSLASVPASGALEVYAQASEASPTVLQAQRDDAQARLPELPAPTGLPAQARPPAMLEPSPGMPAASEAGSRPVPGAAGENAPRVGELVPEAPALPAPAPTQLAGGEGEAREGQRGNDPELARSAQDALANVGILSSEVPTTATERPSVDLSGEADPGQLETEYAASDRQTREARTGAARSIQQDFGENAIFPEPDGEVLGAALPGGGATVPAMGQASAPQLPAEALASIDAEATPLLQERIGAEQQRYAQAETQYETDFQTAHAQAHEDIDALEADARTTQTGARATARAEVGLARRDWQGELDTVEAGFQDRAQATRNEHRGKVENEAKEGNKKAGEHITRAEQDAATEQQRADADVERKKQEAQKKSSGFWGWVKSKAKALIDGLKAAINFVYDNLRKAVKAIFDAAKKLALAAIELARKAIVGLIQAYGAILKGLVSIALAAFPDIRDRMVRRIDQAVETATELVNTAAEALKKGVAAVLDFLAETIDKVLGLVQDIYNGILTVVGMLITGELRELLARVGNLIEAAKTAPGQFETAAYEELLGGNLDQPLSPAELIAAGRMPPALAEGVAPAAAMLAGAEAGAEGPLPGPPWTEGNVGVDAVAEDEELSPGLTAELLQRTGGGDGEVTLEESEDADRSLEALLGVRGGTEQTPSGGQTEAGPQAFPDDGLTPRERAEVKWEAMKKGMATWWEANWPYVLAGGVIAVAGFIVANILTGGAILAALPTIMSVVGSLFTGLMVVQLAGHVRDFLQKGWNGDIPGGGKSLAKALAAGAIELISLLTFKVGSAAVKGARAAARGTMRGAQALARGASSTMRLFQRGASYVLQGGKVLLRGVGRGIARGAERLRELGARLLSRTRFKGFRIRILARRFILEGRINPWVKLVEGKLAEVPEGTSGAKRVDEYQWATWRLQRRFDKPPRSLDELAEARRAKAGRRQAQEARTMANAEQQAQAMLRREEAIKELSEVDQRLKAQRGGGEGHGHKDHGYQTSIEAQRRRIETGRSPSGRIEKPVESAAKFYSPETELEALRKGEQELQKALQAGHPTMADGKPNRFAVVVTSDHPRGFGGGYRRKLDASGSPIVNPKTGIVLTEPVRKIKEAWVIFEYVPQKNIWAPVTYYPWIH